MIVEVKVPEVGESITEGLLTEWLKEDSDQVLVDEALFELETDKVTMTIPAEAAGKLSIAVVAGETVHVGQVVGSIDTSQASELEAQVPATPQAEAVRAMPQQVVKEEVTAPKGAGPLVSAPAGIEQAKEKLAQTAVQASMALSPARWKPRAIP